MGRFSARGCHDPQHQRHDAVHVEEDWKISCPDDELGAHALCILPIVFSAALRERGTCRGRRPLCFSFSSRRLTIAMLPQQASIFLCGVWSSEAARPLSPTCETPETISESGSPLAAPTPRHTFLAHAASQSAWSWSCDQTPRPRCLPTIPTRV